ncbi:MAG: hypothetical protein VW879_13825, partial [Opitutae bacterium]
PFVCRRYTLYMSDAPQIKAALGARYPDILPPGMVMSVATQRLSRRPKSHQPIVAAIQGATTHSISIGGCGEW